MGFFPLFPLGRLQHIIIIAFTAAAAVTAVNKCIKRKCTVFFPNRPPPYSPPTVRRRDSCVRHPCAHTHTHTHIRVRSNRGRTPLRARIVPPRHCTRTPIILFFECMIAPPRVAATMTTTLGGHATGIVVVFARRAPTPNTTSITTSTTTMCHTGVRTVVGRVAGMIRGTGGGNQTSTPGPGARVGRRVPRTRRRRPWHPARILPV